MTLAMEMERMKRIVSTEAKQQGLAEGRVKGRAEGASGMAKTIAKAMLHDGVALEVISSYTHIPTEQLRELAKESH